MPLIPITVIALACIVLICAVVIVLLSRPRVTRGARLQLQLQQFALENNVELSITEQLKKAVFGIDPRRELLMAVQDCPDSGVTKNIVDLTAIKTCRKQKKWIHIPAHAGNSRPETHLEKIILLFEFTTHCPPAELIFYAYRHNSIFQMHELEQKADYWELLINQRLYKQNANILN
ncbi:MAG: hypothetical protein ABIU63_15095 [Chitinophagaceae bacterium]